MASLHIFFRPVKQPPVKRDTTSGDLSIAGRVDVEHNLVLVEERLRGTTPLISLGLLAVDAAS